MGNSNKVWDFREQLAVGSRGEELFLEYYPKKIVVYPERDGDFIEVYSGKKIELKSDSYNMDKTENFFFERYSNIETKTPGSVWQALSHNCDIFCYQFVRHNIWFQFTDLPKLAARLEELTAGKGLIWIKNKGWVTGGFTVKRKLLEDLYTIWEF